MQIRYLYDTIDDTFLAVKETSMFLRGLLKFRKNERQINLA
jgi:hypothetical protein